MTDTMYVVPDAVRACASAAAGQVRDHHADGVSWASIEVAEAIVGARPMDDTHVRAMATHFYDDASTSGQLFGGEPGRAWARSVIVADQHTRIAALVAEQVAAGVAATPPSTLRTLSAQLARVDHRFRVRVEAILSQSMRRAERHARTKAQQRARRRTKTQLAAAASDWSAGRITPAVLAALDVTDEELLAAGFVDASDQVVAAFRERQKARRKALAKAFEDEGLDDADLARAWGPTEDTRADAIAAFIAIAMFSEARSRLTSGLSGTDLYDPRGEIPFDTAVPTAVVQAVMKVADGATVSPQNTVDAPPASGAGVAVHPLSDQTDDLVANTIRTYAEPADSGGQTLADVMASNDIEGDAIIPDGGGDGPAGPIPVRYTWQVGDPQHPFDPHQQLAGSQFTQDDYWEVLAKDPNEWPYGTVAWTPGDHGGCQCWLDIEWGI